MPPSAGADGPGALPASLNVSRETMARLEIFVTLLKRWQKAKNLVADRDIHQLWGRHIADSLQISALFPDARHWLDIGSGAGFPGMITAIVLAGTPGARITLVESNQGKCAFLRAAARETGAPADVECARIDSVVQRWRAPLEMISARALAPLATLCGMVQPLVARGAHAVFHKGRDFEVELAEATKYWVLDLVKYRSKVSDDGVIVEIRQILPREGARP